MLAGCVHQNPHPYLAPSSTRVIKAVSEAQSAVNEVQEFVTPAGIPAFQKLSSTIVAVQGAVASYSQQVETQTMDLARAQDEVNYWHKKHSECLKQLWILRLIILAELVALAAWFAIRYGKLAAL